MSIEIASTGVSAVKGPYAAALHAPPVDLGQPAGLSTSADAQRFGQTLSAYRERAAGPVDASPAREADSIGRRLVSELSDMSGRLKADHKYVSSMIEKATVGGDDAMMMKAMMALSDYQQRVQIVSKTVAKAASSLDQLTKLQ